MKRLRKLSIFSPRTRDQRGFILIFAVVLIPILLLYGGIAIKSAKSARDQILLDISLRNALNIVINASSGIEDRFQNACESLRVEWLPNLNCSPAGAGFTSPTYTSTQSSPARDGNTSCSATFRYIQSDPVRPNTAYRPNFCITVDCQDQLPLLGAGEYFHTGGETCVASESTAAYVAIDYSRSLVNIYGDREWDANLGPPQARTYLKVPPSFVTLNNNNDFYFSTRNVPKGASDYQTILGWDAPTIFRAMIDLQLPGVREAIQDDPNLANYGLVKYPIRLPFSLKEVDQRKNTISSFCLSGENPCRSFTQDDCSSLPFQYFKAAIENPDGLTLNTLGSLPDLVNSKPNSPCKGTGADGVADPMQYMGAMTRMDIGMSSVMKDWWTHVPGQNPYIAHRDPPDENVDPGNQVEPYLHSYTRGGHITSDYFSNMCFGRYLSIYKNAAELMVYMLADFGIRAGIMGYSNGLFPLLPLYPLSFYIDPTCTPLYGKRVSDDAVKVLGPTPNQLQSASCKLANGDPPSTYDFINQQFGDPNKNDPGARYDRTVALDLVHAKSYCGRWLSWDVDQGNNGICPPQNPNCDRLYYSALPNPYNPVMKTSPDPNPDTCLPQPALYQNPMVYEGDGICYTEADERYYHDDSLNYLTPDDVDICKNPVGDPLLPLANNGNSFTDYTSADIKFPWRWCRMDGNVPDTGANIATAIQSLAAGGWSRSGFPIKEHLNRNLPPQPPGDVNHPLLDPGFPYKAEDGTFTSGALLQIKRAFNNPELVAKSERKIALLITDGLPNTNLVATINNGPQSYNTFWFGEDPFIAPRSGSTPEMPNYDVGTNPSNLITGLKETLHIIHDMRLRWMDKITIAVLILNPGIPVPDRLRFIAGLHEPNVVNGPDPINGNYGPFNFCKAAGEAEINGDGEANYVGDPDRCRTQNSGLLPPEILLVYLQKGDLNGDGVIETPTETYSAFRQRIFQSLGASVAIRIGGLDLSK